jgi:hypothetical protein
MTHPECPPPQAVSTQKESKEASRQVGAFILFPREKRWPLARQLPGFAEALPVLKELFDSSIR